MLITKEYDATRANVVCSGRKAPLGRPVSSRDLVGKHGFSTVSGRFGVVFAGFRMISRRFEAF